MNRPQLATMGSWLALAIGVLAGASLVWWVGPALAVGGWRPLGSALVRALLIATLLLLPLLNVLRRRLQVRRLAQRRLAESGDPDSVDSVVDRALLRLATRPPITATGWRGLRARWQQFNGPDPLLALPWVLVIGQPVAAARRALVLEGYGFPPLADRAPEPPCSWCITPQAVLILVEGPGTDGATQTWAQLLRRLSKARPLQPVSAVLVLAGLESLTDAPDGPEWPSIRPLGSWLLALGDLTGLAPPLHLAVLDSARDDGPSPGPSALQFLADGFGVAATAQRPARLVGNSGATLRRLIDEQVLPAPEQALFSQRHLNRQRWLVRGGYAATLLVAAALAVGWAVSRQQNLALIEQQGPALTALAQALAAATPAMSTGDVSPLLPVLDPLQAAAQGGARSPWTAHLGLFQGDRLQAFAGAAYERLLGQGLAPALKALLETRLGGMSDQRAPEAYESLRLYLAFNPENRTSQSPAVSAEDIASVAGQFAGQFRLTPAQQQSLRNHLAALAAAGDAPGLSSDAALVADARQKLKGAPLALFVHQDLVRRFNADGQAPLSVTDLLGNADARFLTRKSGRPLSEGVPRLYTLDGIARYVALLLNDSSLNKTRQVLGLAAPPPDQAGATDAAIRVAALQVYQKAYSAAWADLLQDLRLAPVTDADAAAQLAATLKAADSPLAALLRTAAAQTAPGKLLPTSTFGSDSWKQVDDGFAPLHAWLAGQPPPLATALTLLAQAVQATAAGGPPPTLAALQTLPQPIPQPLQNMLAQFDGGGATSSRRKPAQ